VRCKAKLDFADQKIEEPVGIESSESQVEQTALDAAGGVLLAGLSLSIFQEPGRSQSAEECGQFSSRQRGLEFVLSALANDIQFGFAVKLAGDEIGLFRQTIKPIEEGIFNDKYDFLTSDLLADG